MAARAGPEAKRGSIVTDPGRAGVRVDDFGSGALKLDNLGDDAHTARAVFGQIAGTVYGVWAIPDGWLRRQAMYDEIGTVHALSVMRTDDPSS